MQNLIVFTDDLLSFELLFLLKVSRANHISFDLSLSQHPIKHSFAYQGMNNSNKRGELKCRILWIHLPSISSHYESKQMPGLTKLYIDSKTSSHTHNCLIWLLHFGDESEEITDALTLREHFREWRCKEMMLRTLKSFLCLPLTKHGPHLQSYLSFSEDAEEGKMYTIFIVSCRDVTFILITSLIPENGRAEEQALLLHKTGKWHAGKMRALFKDMGK